MRLTGPARLGVLTAGLLLCTCLAQDAPPGDVDLEPADDGGSGSQQLFYTPEGASSLNQVVDPAQRRAREADRLYTSSLKILASLKARGDQGERTSAVADYFDSSETTSRLLVPISPTPLLDYLETTLEGRAKYLSGALSAYRSLVSRKSRNSTQVVSQKGNEDFMTKLLQAKYLRTASRTPAIKDKKRAAVTMAIERLGKAYKFGKSEAALVLADLFLWGRYDLPQNTVKATEYYQSIAESTGDPLAQYMLGFLHSTNFGFATDSARKEGDGDQGAAVLHYTFSALSGQAEAEMTLGYRNWVGIGVKQSCPDALPWYKNAADRAMQAFKAGPPGGRHLPPPKVRLADVQGGVYGPGASTTTAMNQHSQSPGTVLPKTEREWEDLLEYYLFHADRGDAAFMFRIGRIYYQGFNPIGPNGGYGGSETGGRDFARALRWFMRIARAVWPRDPIAAYTSPAQLNANPARNGQATANGPNRQVSHHAFYDESKDVKLKVEDSKSMAAGLSAGYLGRMYLRGEGFPEQDFQKAFLWFQRGVSYGDRESHNGLGMMYRDGLGVLPDQVKALSHFQTAAAADHPEALVNVARYHLARGELTLAVNQLEHAIRHGDAFQAYYYLAEINNANPGRPELCPVTTAFYKIVAERGDWRTSQPWWEAEKAWAVGDTKRALLGYWIMAERGYEVAQNNVAWILDQNKRMLSIPHYDYQLDKATDRLALAFWTRSAAQDNGDALVKMGDYYMRGLGVSSGVPQPEKAAACYSSAANTHYSSIAMYNLGWMHENGFGVSQDFHLAKRYYDLALESNAEAYLPVTLSLAKLHLRSLYKAIKSGDVKSISLFLSSEQDYDEETPEGQEQPTRPHRWLWSWRRIRDEFFRRWVGEQMARQQAQRRVPAEVDELRPIQDDPPAPAPGQAPENTGDHFRQVRVELEAQDDPIDWARRRREEMMQDAGDEFGGADDLDIPDFFGDTIGGRGRNDDDSDVVETLAILGLCLVLAYLVYVRQARYDGNRPRHNVEQVPQLVPAAAAPAPQEAQAQNAPEAAVAGEAAAVQAEVEGDSQSPPDITEDENEAD